MEKFINKDTLPIIVIAVIVTVAIIFQSQYFATKLDLAETKLQMADLKNELMQYSDNKDEIILKELDLKYDKIMVKLDKLK